MDTAKLLIRSVREEDLTAIMNIASEVGPGFNSLPYDSKVIASKIERSMTGFARLTNKEARAYFFVMEDLETGEVVGTAAIEAQVGRPWIYNNYKVSINIHVSEALSKRQDHRILFWTNDFENASEFGTLYLKPQYRGEKRGEFLSRSRCLFIAEYPDLIGDCIVSELRSAIDEEGRSPFWEAVGHHFIGLSLKEADYLRIAKGRQFISDLMPRYPIYVDILPKAAQMAIGNTREEARPALHVLEKEGFRNRGYIDIFDGGPVVEAQKLELKTVKMSRQVKIKECKMTISEGLCVMLSNVTHDFRARKCHIELSEEGEISVEADVAKSLNVAEGDIVRFCPLR